MKAICFFVFLFPLFLNAQQVFIELKARIDEPVFEVSGVIMDANLNLWVIGDSGNEPEIYRIDNSGFVEHILRLENAQNIDWEEIQRDDTGKFFIADIGNNLSARTDLKFYIIEDEDLLNHTVDAEIIQFSYEDQSDYTPDLSGAYDSEAFFVYNDLIHLFSKDRGFPGNTKYYTMPAHPGSHTANLITQRSLPYWVNACTYDHNRDVLYIISDEHFCLTNEFLTSSFSREIFCYPILTSQAEGICLKNTDEFFIVEDVESGLPSNLLRLKYLQSGKSSPAILIFPNPTTSELNIAAQSPFSEIVITDFSGKILVQNNIRFLTQYFTLPVDELGSGMYIIELLEPDSQVKLISRFVKD